MHIAAQGNDAVRYEPESWTARAVSGSALKLRGFLIISHLESVS
jgi:hypothetical protein